MAIKGNTYYKVLIYSTINKLSKIHKIGKEFFFEIIVLFLSIKGKLNFLQFERYVKYTEQRYRQQFKKPFNFMDFNTELTLSIKSGDYAIAFDPSYIQKSGKRTSGLGWYWSGSANQSKWGLEIGGLAVLDIDNHTAFHLEAVQTLIDPNASTTLIDWYLNIIVRNIIPLQRLSHYIVADTYFLKKKFVDGLNIHNMHLISRLRDDADLRYISFAEPTGKKGRPKMYAGKIDFNNIDLEYFEFVDKQNDIEIYTAICNSKSLKKDIRIVLTIDRATKAKKKHKIYFSTDIKQTAISILNFYKNRFQIEFLY